MSFHITELAANYRCAECLQTPKRTDRARSDPRNDADFQLRQPPLPTIRVRGVVGVRGFPDAHLRLMVSVLIHTRCQVLAFHQVQ
jgi:hypothetical protein